MNKFTNNSVFLNLFTKKALNNLTLKLKQYKSNCFIYYFYGKQQTI
jgi:hypothetical protein